MPALLGPARRTVQTDWRKRSVAGSFQHWGSRHPHSEAVTFWPRCECWESDRLRVGSGVWDSITANYTDLLSDDRSITAKKSSYIDSFAQDRAQTAICAVTERSLSVTSRLRVIANSNAMMRQRGWPRTGMCDRPRLRKRDRSGLRKRDRG